MNKLAGCLSIALIVVSAPTSSGARSAACDTISVRSWKVKVDVQDETYRIGENAKVDLLVTQKKTGAPVAGALAAVLVVGRKDRAAIGVSETDARGMSTVKVKLLRRLVPGLVKLHAYGYRRQVDAYCASVSEYGYKKVPKAFRIKP
jgi:hypothetical protein